MYAQPSRDWDSLFTAVPFATARCKKLRLKGVLPATPDLEEVPILLAPSGPTTKDDGKRAVRAFLVRGFGLAGEGLQSGDYVLIEEVADPPADALVLARVDSCYFLRPSSRVVFDARLRPRILGLFIGIVRKRGFARPTAPGMTPPSNRGLARATANLRLLRGQLGMLEATCASTGNRKLRDALRNEAHRVRQQIQSGALQDKHC